MGPGSRLVSCLVDRMSTACLSQWDCDSPSSQRLWEPKGRDPGAVVGLEPGQHSAWAGTHIQGPLSSLQILGKAGGQEKCNPGEPHPDLDRGCLKTLDSPTEGTYRVTFFLGEKSGRARSRIPGAAVTLLSGILSAGLMRAGRVRPSGSVPRPGAAVGRGVARTGKSQGASSAFFSWLLPLQPPELYQAVIHPLKRLLFLREPKEYDYC